MSDLDFPPPPTNPVPGDKFSGPRNVQWLWDGEKWTAGGGLNGAGSGGIPEAPTDNIVYGRENQDWTPVLALKGGTMEGSILLQPGTPINALQAVTKQYVDEVAASGELYQGTWEVAANSPDISLGAALDATNYLCITADPNVAEQAPSNIPGIGGRLINNGDRIYWASPIQVWQVIHGDNLSLEIGDSRYLQLAGGTMVGAQYFTSTVPLHFYDTAGYPGSIQVNAADTFRVTTTNAGGGEVTLFSIPMRQDAAQLNIAPDTQFGGAVWLFEDPLAEMQAATKRYVDTHIAAVSGGLVFIGTIDGTTGNCVFTANSGLPNGPLPDPTLYPNTFVVCDNPGTIPIPPAAGMVLSAGDWVVSDGTFWYHIGVGGAGLIAAAVAVNPTVLGQSNVQTALQTITTTYLPLTGGVLTGQLSIAPANNLVVGSITVPPNVGPSQLFAPFISSSYYAFNTYLTAPGSWNYVANGPAALEYLDGNGNIQYLLAPTGVAGTAIPYWINPLLIQPWGGIQVGGGQNIGNPLSIYVGGGGNAVINYTVAGVRSWYAGLDNDAQFHIADLSAGTDRLIIGTDGSINLYGPGIRYNYFGGNVFSLTWDGSFNHVIVNNTDTGQLATIGWTQGTYLNRNGDNTGGSFNFGYVGSYGDINANGNMGVGGHLQAGSINASSYIAGTNVWAKNDGSFGLFADAGDNRRVQFAPAWTLEFAVATGGLNWVRYDGAVLFNCDYYGNFNIPGYFNGLNISDVRVKKNIHPYQRGLKEILELHPVVYEYNGEGGTQDDGKIWYGFNAQDVEPIMPECVKPTWEPNEKKPMRIAGQLSLDDQPIFCALINAIQEMNVRMTKLEQRR